MRRPLVMLALLALASCEANCENAPDLERMIQQPRADAYEASRFFADGRAMRPKIEGTIDRGQLLGRSELRTGTASGAFVAQVPLAVTRSLAARGQERFGVYCAACHGALGDGRSQVAENMPLRKPPSLLKPEIRGYPPGRIYAVIERGYGFMRSYASDLSVTERWAVVVYVRALQLSQEVALDTLSPALQREAAPWLR